MFSIVVPVYNKRALLRATVESALQQSFAGFELILIDDGSTDGSLEAVADLTDPRIRILRQENGGASAARNAGMAAARHQWIAFLDADDLWLPDHLAELDRIRSRFPEAGLIGTAFFRGTVTVPRSEEGDIRLISYFEEVGRGRVPFWTSSAAVRADAARAVGGFNDDPIGQDSEYWARVAFDHPVAASTRATAIYRLGTGGIIDRARYRWRGRDIRSAADISSAAALVSERYEQVESPQLRRSLDLYLDRFVSWCLEHSVEIGDVRTVRALRPIYRIGPTRRGSWLMRAARLSKPAARAVFMAYLAAKSVKRRLKGR
jgi:glycosyltransferase involved in cell wall biosynthesis